SRVVITHDGAGSILNCLLNKKITVVVPRLKEFNECKYENKLDLALELEKQNKIHLIRDIDLLNLKLIEDLTTIGMMGDSKAIGRMEDSKAIGRMEDSKSIENFESKNNLLINIKKYIKI
ncbi:glycosyltransferase, partial [Methanothrix sp.]